MTGSVREFLISFEFYAAMEMDDYAELPPHGSRATSKWTRVCVCVREYRISLFFVRLRQLESIINGLDSGTKHIGRLFKIDGIEHTTTNCVLKVIKMIHSDGQLSSAFNFNDRPVAATTLKTRRPPKIPKTSLIHMDSFAVTFYG